MGPGASGEPVREPPATVGARAVGLDVAELTAVVRARLAVLPEGARLGVAVSGGPDSAALALLVNAARPDVAVTLLHVRHGLRDDAPDAAAAGALGALLDLPVRVRAVDVSVGRDGPEATARRARYGALAAMAREEGLVAVCVGHTADDQAETVLLNLVRGTGIGGLAGMRHDRVVDGLRVLRPLLDVRRDDVRAAAQQARLPTVEDPTNADPDQRRARARHDVLPVLAGLAGGPGDPVGALTRLAALARDDDALLEDLAEQHAAALVVRWGPVALLHAEALATLPRALARRLVRRMSDVPLPADAVEAVVEADEGARLSLPGVQAALRSQGWLSVGPQDPSPLEARPLGRDGVALPELGLALRVTSDPAMGSGDAPTAGAVTPPAGRPARGDDARPWIPLPISAAASGWTVRGPAAGDRIRSGGRLREVRDLLSDRAVPAAVRPFVPLVEDGRGAVVWIPGIAVCDGLPSGPSVFLVLAESDTGWPIAPVGAEDVR